MNRTALEQEIRDLEMRLSADSDEATVPPASEMPESEAFEAEDEAVEEVPVNEEETLAEEINDLEQEITGCGHKKASHGYNGVEWEEADAELAALYNEINREDQSAIEEGGEGESGFMSGGECQNVECKVKKPTVARQRTSAQVNNPEEPHGKGGLWQDQDVVEELMGVGDKAEDILDVAKESSKFNDSEFIYASRLKEASQRLDNVAAELEKRGGAWKKFAFRVDRIADAVDTERLGTLKKIASRKAGRK